jgi:hypothetical protein
MANAVIPYNFAAPAVALAKKRENSANSVFLSSNAPSYPELSIKGKVFTLVKGDVRKILTRKLTGDDGTVEEVAITTIPLVVVAGNPRARVYFDKGYTEGADNQKPLCYTFDGKAPDAQVEKPQAKNCQVCPHARWGSKIGSTEGAEAKGTACTPRIRMAVTDPNTPAAPFMLNVPPASAANWRAAVGMVDNHGKDFFEVSFKVKFDMEAPTPKLVFEPYGMLTDEALAKVKALQADPVVQDILGMPTPIGDAPAETPKIEAPKTETKPDPKPAIKPPADEPEVSLGGLADEEAPPVKAEKPKTEKPKTETKPKAEKPKTETKPVDLGDDLLGGLANLLGSTDD